jgi:hypothetical protein
MAHKKPCAFCPGGDGVHYGGCQNPDKSHVVFWHRSGEKLPDFLKGIVDESRSLDPEREPD